MTRFAFLELNLWAILVAAFLNMLLKPSGIQGH
jgi:hypothetical protein